MPKTIYDRVQGFIHSMEEGAGLILLKRVTVCLAFAALALYFNLTHQFEGFASPEGMETAHLARRLSAGKGYTTESIRPLVLHFLQEADPAKKSQVLQHPVPDLSHAPGYPVLLAGLMKVLPIRFAANRDAPWVFPPETWIRGINEVIFFLAALALFHVARRLFDSAVAWLSAVVFSGTELYWKFSGEALPTMWLILLFLLLVWCLLALDERERRQPAAGLGASLALAAVAGAVAGIGALSLYSFAWILVPVLIFEGVFFSRARYRLALATAIAFLAVLTPWVARNAVLSQTCFGTAGYALVENTPRLEADTLERTFDPTSAFANTTPHDVIDKLIVNGGEILKDALPRLGGNWASAFFLCGLLLPFRSPALQRIRLWLVGTLLLLALIQAGCQTHVSADQPVINSENLLVILSPLVLVFGVGVFFTLMEHIVPADPGSRRGVVGLFAVVLCAPLLLALIGPPKFDPYSPYAPYHIEKTAAMMREDELMISDIPWAVAWYGDRACGWLPLNDDAAFQELNALQPVHAVFLTERTSDRHFLSQMIIHQRNNQGDWSYFYLDSLPGWGHEEVPTGFPLRYAITNWPPDQMFISDREDRWRKTH
jgi:hypothetical protein